MRRTLLTACLLGAGVAAVLASDSLSEPLARTLAATMVEQHLDAVAVADPAEPGQFAAVLLVPGQLLVMSARYPVPTRLAELLAKKAYRQVYTALSSVRDTNFFVQDLDADGLHRDGESVDVLYEEAVNQVIFDGHPEKRRISKTAYGDKFLEADRRYSYLLNLLLNATKTNAPVPSSN